MAFVVKNWQNFPGVPNLVDGAAMQDLETRLSNYTNTALDSYVAATATTANSTLTISNGSYVNFLLNVSTTVAFTLSGATAAVPYAFTLNTVQSAVGLKTITWPGAVKWAYGATAVLSTGPNKTDILSFYTLDGGTTIYGFVAGLDMR